MRDWKVKNRGACHGVFTGGLAIDDILGSAQGHDSKLGDRTLHEEERGKRERDLHSCGNRALLPWLPRHQLACMLYTCTVASELFISG